MGGLDSVFGGDDLLDSALDQEMAVSDLAHEIAMRTDSVDEFQLIYDKILELGLNTAQHLWNSGAGFEIEVPV